MTACLPEQPAGDDAQAPAGQPARASRRLRTVVTIAVVLAVLAAAGIAFGVYQLLQPPAPVSTYAVAFSGRTPLAVVAAGDAFQLENVSTGQLTASLTPLNATSGLLSVAFSPDGAMVGLEYHGGRIGVWDTATGRSIATFPDPPGGISSYPYPPGGVSALAFSHDDKTLAVGAFDGRTYLWSIATRRQIALLTGPPRAQVMGAAFSPGDRTLGITSEDGNAYLWDVATRKLIATIKGGSGKLAFSPDGTMLATADPVCCDETSLWSLATYREIAHFDSPGPRAPLAYSPDGAALATGDVNGGAVLWSLATHQPIARFTDTTATSAPEITAVAFSPNGQTIAVGDTKGHVILWKVRTPGS